MSTLMEPISHVRVIPKQPDPACSCAGGSWGPVAPPFEFLNDSGSQEWTHGPACSEMTTFEDFFGEAHR